MHPRQNHLKILRIPEGAVGNKELEEKFRHLDIGLNSHYVRVIEKQPRSLKLQFQYEKGETNSDTFNSFFYVPVVAWIRELIMDPVNKQLGQPGPKEQIPQLQYNVTLYLNGEIYTSVFPRGSPRLEDGRVVMEFVYFDNIPA